MYQPQRNHRRNFFFFFPLLIAAVAFLLGGVVMWLWNAILPAVTGVSPLTYWQAMGLLVLSRILFGGFRFGGRPRHHKPAPWRDKWANMNAEEREHFKNEWKKRCGRGEA
jgi:Ca2+/H+ antiporter, TMEM165/GDT1 family